MRRLPPRWASGLRATLRAAWVCGFALWAGGFVTYSALVLPALREALGEHDAGRLVTRPVAALLNWAGAAALAVWLAEAALSAVPIRFAERLALAGLAASLAAGVLLHRSLAERIDQGRWESFYTWHRLYLLNCTVQVAGQAALLPLVLGRWRRADRSEAA